MQVQKLIERLREGRQAQKRIFYALMATRATRVAPDHVQALNAIDLEFCGSSWRRPTAKEKEVLRRWRIYAHHLNINVEESSQAQITAWLVNGDELFTDLLEAMAKALGYTTFDRVQLKVRHVLAESPR